jgi:hypothetical protein
MRGRSRHSAQNFHDARRKIQPSPEVSASEFQEDSGEAKFLTSLSSLRPVLCSDPMEMLADDQIA